MGWVLLLAALLVGMVVSLRFLGSDQTQAVILFFLALFSCRLQGFYIFHWSGRRPKGDPEPLP